MISFLEGEVAERAGGRVVIAVGGVGYEVQVPASTLASLPPVGRTARIHTRMVVRDDAMTLFGFGSADERELFDLLVTVNGVGPKVALSFLSEDAAKAARISNHLAQTYLATQVEAKYAAAQRAIEWLSKRIKELRIE